VVELTRVSDVHKSQSPLDLAQIFEPVRDDLARVDEEFLKHVQSRVQLIPQIGKYLQTSGGKRIRPATLLMAARMAGYQGDRAVLYASVIEFVHTATLVHDDIIDESGTRRGRVAVHSRWGTDITVLLGDYLYIKSMGMALTYDSLDIVRLLCEVTLRMIEGELYQLTKTGDVDITVDEHLDIIRRKTAHLFGGSAQIGGMLGATTPEQQAALWEYGFNLGIAFQLVDDLLDYTADERNLGKPIASDLREGKVTLPIIHLLERGGRAREIVDGIVRDRDVTREQWAELKQMLVDSQAIARARRQAEHYANVALQHLSGFPPSPERDALLALPEYVLSRDR
jgi:octaprenyl-diphosphate synthase